MPGEKVTRLVHARVRRLERRADAIERRLRDFDDHTEQLEDLLTRLVRIVALQRRRVARDLARIDERLDRMMRALTTGRTSDLRRLAELERRIR